jgi:hypothetical protein
MAILSLAFPVLWILFEDISRCSGLSDSSLTLFPLLSFLHSPLLCVRVFLLTKP